MIHLQFHRCHLGIFVHAIQEAHKDNLRVSLAAVAWARSLAGLANLDNNQVGHNVSLVLIQTRVYFAICENAPQPFADLTGKPLATYN